MSQGPVILRRAVFSHFEALRDAVQDAPIDIVQLGRGQMTGSLAHLSIGSLGISTGSFSRALRGRGLQSPYRWALGMVLDSPASFQHFEASPGDLVIVPPDQEIYARYYGGNNYGSMLIAPSELFEFIESQQPGASEAAVWRSSVSVISNDPAISAAFAEQFRIILAVLQEHGATMSAASADFYKRNILEMMTAPVLNGVSYRGPRLAQSAVKLVRDVERYLVDAGNRPIHISELSGVFNVSRRRLHRAFIDVLGVPPIAFLRRKRLGDVHEALLTAGPAATVRQVAIDHGFGELGRFAAAYRRLFGELPSQTFRHRILPMIIAALISVP
ncbi:helix-turn-helix domain-containing protein [Bradyrhizobium sp. 170]|uniref:helix-turn-helix domain-containing protein n=1 Tax=Bradyrhizobium sp. 170 TaxID=2782641 RepID=UPI001FFF4620|nr:helix-turn-helix domain-containing protein [Bradyrhizobium sp. 170]UPK03133.1 AraC family transcriptional regulator [Bradyrhizobium sp. 170]